MPKKIVVDILKDGKVKIETENFKGESCIKSIKELFSEFIEIEDFELKSDYYENDETVNIEMKIDI
jgi:hypothetical protein